MGGGGASGVMCINVINRRSLCLSARVCLSLCAGPPTFVHISSPITGSVYEDDPEGICMQTSFVWFVRLGVMEG